ncbi:MAG TPA: hypothetical protein VGB85_28835 [Nannocystis sp.]
MPASIKNLVLPALLLLACKDDDVPDEDTTGTSTGTTTASDTEPTGGVQERSYWQDVAPIYYERCVTCHQSGGIAPFALDNYADAAGWAPASAAAVAERTMPPWLVTDDGTCGDFRGSRALASDEIDTIVAWAAAGAPEGQPRDDLKTPALPGLDADLALQTPVFAPEIVGGPLAEFDEYRCFLVDPKIDHDVFLTGYQVTPGTPELVHHVLAMPVDPDAIVEGGQTNAQRMQALDDESPDRLGWPCFSMAGEGVEAEGLPVTWAPGMGAVEYPANTGVRLAAGRKVVIQIHYNLHDPELAGKSDSTKLELRLAESVEREGFFDMIDLFIDTLFDAEPDSLAPGQESVKYDWSVPIGQHYLAGEGQVEVYGIFPHMHERGRRWQARLVDGDETQCIGDVQSWDFDWQLYYFYDQPQIIRPGTRLEVTCDFDTRGAPGPVTPGWGTQNEMCLAGLYVVP